MRERLAELLGSPVALGAPTASARSPSEAVGELRDGDVLLLENLRFHAGETANDPEFAAALAQLADVYVERRLRRRAPRARLDRGRRAPAADARPACCCGASWRRSADCSTRPSIRSS